MQINNLFFKLLITISFCLGVVNNHLQAQNDSSALGFLGGYAQNGFGVNLNYNYYTDSNKYIQAGIYYSNNNLEERGIKVPFNIFTFNAGYFYSLYTSRRKTLKFSLGGGGVFGYEVINNGNNQLPNGAIINGESKFIYGAFISAEVDIYLSNDFSFILKANEYYHVNSDLGELTPYIGAGFRFFLY